MVSRWLGSARSPVMRIPLPASASSWLSVRFASPQVKPGEGPPVAVQDAVAEFAVVARLHVPAQRLGTGAHHGREIAVRGPGGGRKSVQDRV